MQQDQEREKSAIHVDNTQLTHPTLSHLSPLVKLGIRADDAQKW
jgi:hypothetical protein